MNYIYIINDKIDGCGMVEQLTDGITNVIVDQTLYDDFINTPDKYMYKDGEIVENPNYEEEQKEKEQERINNLTMTAQDFKNILNGLGLSDEVILKILLANPSFMLSLTTCQNVYCGVVRQMCPIQLTENVTITEDMVIKAFKAKNDLV